MSYWEVSVKSVLRSLLCFITEMLIEKLFWVKIWSLRVWTPWALENVYGVQRTFWRGRSFSMKAWRLSFAKWKIRVDTRRGYYLLLFTAKSREDVSQCRVISYFLCELRAIFVGQDILVLIWLSVYCWVKKYCFVIWAI